MARVKCFPGFLAEEDVERVWRGLSVARYEL